MVETASKWAKAAGRLNSNAAMIFAAIMLIVVQSVVCADGLDDIPVRAAQPSVMRPLQLAQTSVEEAPGKGACGLSAKEILIGSCSPFTGQLKMRGPALTHAATAYFNYINECGGVHGRMLRLVSCDDAFNPEKAIECFNSCLKDKVFASGFIVSSAALVKYLKMADINKMPIMGFNVGPPSACEFHPTGFNLRLCYQDEVEHLVTGLWRHNLKKIALVYQNDAFGACVRAGLLAELKKRNSAPLVEVSCSRTQTDIDSDYDQVKAANPDAVIFAINTVPLEVVIKRRSEDNFKAICTTLSSMEDALQKMGKASDGFLIAEQCPPLDSGQKSVELYRKLLKKYFPQDQPSAHGLESFLNAMVMVEGLKLAGADLTREKFVRALESIRHFDLGLDAIHKVSFGPTNHVGWSDKVITIRATHDGRQVDIKDSDWRPLP